jgi:putative acetyltransferase
VRPRFIVAPVISVQCENGVIDLFVESTRVEAGSFGPEKSELGLDPFWKAQEMIIRRETPTDAPSARAIQVEAFRLSNGESVGGTASVGEPVEARLLDELRVCEGWLPKLSLVAEIDGAVRGHVVTTRGYVDGHPALGLGPIGVEPASQHAGIGSALVHATIGAAEAMDEPFIALLGAPAYYSRFGFVPSTRYGILPPDPAWGGYFQVLTLSAYTPDLQGTFRYAAPFERL